MNQERTDISNKGVLILAGLFRDLASCVALVLFLRDAHYPKSSISTFGKGKERVKTKTLYGRGDEVLRRVYIYTTEFIQKALDAGNKSYMKTFMI